MIPRLESGLPSMQCSMNVDRKKYEGIMTSISSSRILAGVKCRILSVIRVNESLM